jgi:hypothetical protein
MDLRDLQTKFTNEELASLYQTKYSRFDIVGGELRPTKTEYFIDGRTGNSIRMDDGVCTETYLRLANFNDKKFFRDMPQFYDFCINPPLPVYTAQRSYAIPSMAFSHFNVTQLPDSEWAQGKYKALASFTKKNGLRPTNVTVRWDVDMEIDNVYLDFYDNIPYDRLTALARVYAPAEIQTRKKIYSRIESVMLYWSPRLNGFKSWLYEYKLTKA